MVQVTVYFTLVAHSVTRGQVVTIVHIVNMGLMKVTDQVRTIFGTSEARVSL